MAPYQNFVLPMLVEHMAAELKGLHGCILATLTGTSRCEIPFQKMNHEQIVREMFQAATQMELGDGNVTLFWLDNRVEGRSIESLTPNLWRLVSGRAKKTTTVAGGLVANAWVRDIQGGLSVQTLTEYLHLWNTINCIYVCRLRTNLENLGTIEVQVIFAWLAVQDRCWTAARLQRPGLPNHGCCNFCARDPETIDHLLIQLVVHNVQMTRITIESNPWR